jgi:integrase/recombinase XerD
MATRLPTLIPRDDCEAMVIDEWRAGGLGSGTMEVYLVWVRRYRAHCRAQGLDEITHLTRAYAILFAQAYKGRRRGMRVKRSSRAGALHALHAWACALRTLGEAVPPWRPPVPPRRWPALLAAYGEYRRTHRGIASRTAVRDMGAASDFLAVLRARGRRVTRIRAADIDAFVDWMSTKLSRRTITDQCSFLRSFLRFLRATGRVREDLARLVVTPRFRADEKPPRALPWLDVRRILRSVPRHSRLGRRDYAMLLLMAAYGMGSAEVIHLRLDDVDWRAGVLRLQRPKTSVPIELPLLPAVARAIALYIKRARPAHARAREIFLTMGMPYQAISAGVIRHQVRQYAHRAGVVAEVLGGHVFRHSHATRQIDSGAHPRIVSDILGHRRPASTSVYVRVAFRRLRTVGIPVPR